ncbi:MAG: hypothetical protein M1500_02065 [Candidatus Marsarchaeota archaeon]|nr:hypothetical protein [Candidatus Marsarchaeota archaeon]MCL5112480.1 hypothetical protein [Candidatus Marsarchaeota archaeon]
MAEIKQIEQQVIGALRELGATKDSSTKTIGDIVKKSNRPFGLVSNTLMTLVLGEKVKRVPKKDGPAGYYLLEKK